MARPLPPLNALRAFEAAARHLSFTRAADELHVTQAAISHQIKGLEERLGLKLFRRLPRRLILTEEGQILLPELRDAFNRISAAVERITARGAGGTLTVSSMTTIVMGWLVPRLPRFQAAHPEIEVRLVTSQRLVDFTREDIDVAIRFGHGKWPGLKAERMFGERLTPLCGKAFIDQIRTPEDLRNLPLIRSDEEDEWQIWFAAAGVDGIGPIRGPVFDSTRIAAQAAIDGLGIVMAPPALFLDDLAEGRLHQPFPLQVKTDKSYWLVAPEPWAERPKIKAFRNWIFTEMARPGGRPGEEALPVLETAPGRAHDAVAAHRRAR
jgi:LysR family glycine cleavage system transcriptional activator